MNSSSAFKWFLTAMLLLSISWKIAIPSEHQNYSTNGLVEFFERNHFDVVLTATDVPIIQAKRGSCRLQVIRLASDGSDQERGRQLARGADRSFVVYHGLAYARQPIFWTRIDYLWSERLRELGLIKRIAPVIAVAVNSSCNAEGLPWDELLETS